MGSGLWAEVLIVLSVFADWLNRLNVDFVNLLRSKREMYACCLVRLVFSCVCLISPSLPPSVCVCVCVCLGADKVVLFVLKFFVSEL